MAFGPLPISILSTPPMIRKSLPYSFSSSAAHTNRIKVEENIRFRIISDMVFNKHWPCCEVFIPVPEFHVETAVNWLVVHLIIETLAGSHCAFPFRAACLDIHSVSLPLARSTLSNTHIFYLFLLLSTLFSAFSEVFV